MANKFTWEQLELECKILDEARDRFLNQCGVVGRLSFNTSASIRGSSLQIAVCGNQIDKTIFGVLKYNKDKILAQHKENELEVQNKIKRAELLSTLKLTDEQRTILGIEN